MSDKFRMTRGRKWDVRLVDIPVGSASAEDAVDDGRRPVEEEPTEASRVGNELHQSFSSVQRPEVKKHGAKPIPHLIPANQHIENQPRIREVIHWQRPRARAAAGIRREAAAHLRNCRAVS